MRGMARGVGVVLGVLVVVAVGSAGSAATSTGCDGETMRVKKGVEWLWVAETSRNDVWLAGDRWLDKSQIEARGLIEHWDGGRWRTEALPPNTGVGEIAAASPSKAWTLIDVRTGRQRIARWDGHRWSVVGPTFDSPLLSAIATLPNGEAWVVGRAGLILHWDGLRWQRLKAPRDQGWLGDYNAVVARSVKDVWALGFRGSRKGWRTHALHWDGTSWRVVATPDLVNDGGRAEDVGEVFRGGQVGSDRSLYAIGNTGRGRLVIERWNGKRWKVISLPARRATVWASIGSVVVRSPVDVWAARDPLSSNQSPLLYHWNGSTWSSLAVPTGLRSAHEFFLHGVAGDLWSLTNLSGGGSDRLGVATRLRCSS